jgi:hypothetical protein
VFSRSCNTGSDPIKRSANRTSYSDMLEVYRVASAKFRKTGKLGVFPAGTFAPWPWEVPTPP